MRDKKGFRIFLFSYFSFLYSLWRGLTLLHFLWFVAEPVRYELFSCCTQEKKERIGRDRLWVVFSLFTYTLARLPRRPGFGPRLHTAEQPTDHTVGDDRGPRTRPMMMGLAA